MTEPIKQLGRYELLSKVASGGMGEIFLARACGAGGFEKHVIIKTILPHLAEQDEFVTKFLDEGRIVVQLTHGNIVPVFDMGEEDGEYFIAMEYVPGLDLRAILKRVSVRGEQLAIEHALYIASEICKGLGYAHRKTDDDGNPLGIVHRDVSPSNVLVSREGEVKIIDFGVARAADKVAETATGHIQGKCCYMSPEQARGKSLDARSDIFSTGVLLYEMLTLERPFEGRSDLESLELVRQCDADPPGVLRPAVPAEVDEIVERAMAPDPDERYQTIDDMFVELQNEIHRLGHTVTSQRLADALEETFADEEAEDAEDKSRRPPKNLDEAFELELAKLGDDYQSAPTVEKDALEMASTATSVDDAGTQTLSPTPNESPKARQNSAEAPGESSPPDSASQPVAPPDTGESNLPAERTEAESAEIGAEDSESTRPLRKRYLFAAMIAGIVVTAGIATVSALRPTPEATLEINSDPSGAQVHVDGREVAGQTTPATLTLEPDEYFVELTLEGHESHRLHIDLTDGGRIEDDVELDPIESSARQFRITTDPEDAVLMADGERLGAAPQTVEVLEDDVVNVSARAPGCSTIYYALSHTHSRQSVELTLECDSEETEDADAGNPESEQPTDPTPQPQPAANRPVRIATSPRGATVVVDGEDRGESPVEVELEPGADTTIEVRLDGYEPHRTTTRPADITGDELLLRLEQVAEGCLNFRAEYPANNRIAINGDWLDGRHMTLERHPVPAGEITITVQHPESDKEESFQVDVPSGDDCEVLTVWERD